MNPCQGPPHRSRVNGAQHRGRRKEKLQPHIGFSTVTVPSLAANGAVNKHSRSHAPSSQGVPNAGFVAHRQRDSGSHRIGFPRLPSRCSRNWNLWPGSSAVRLKTRCPQGHAPLRLLQGRLPASPAADPRRSGPCRRDTPATWPPSSCVSIGVHTVDPQGQCGRRSRHHGGLARFPL